MAISPNRHAAGDPELQRFSQYLMAERNAATHTLDNYAADLAQFVASKWGTDAEPPYPWTDLSETDARRLTELAHQLTPDARFDADRLRPAIRHGETLVFAVRSRGRIIASATAVSSAISIRSGEASAQNAAQLCAIESMRQPRHDDAPSGAPSGQ